MSYSLDRRSLLRVMPVATALPAGAFPGGARAQTVQDIDAREKAVIEVWQKTPLTIRRAMFVTEKASGYGEYDPRPDNVFKAGEPLIAYLEPVAYGWLQVGPDLYTFGFDVDFAIKLKSTDKVVGERKDFGHLVQQSHARNLEYTITLTLNVSGAPPTDYILVYTLRDVTGPRSATAELPFTIAS
ncbi:MAG TPA: hypothetical protein VJY39_11850 [Acidisphaera sp.]|nr:hypothetical protein [Acidisphaera sp.]